MPQQLDNLVFDRTELDVAQLHDVTARLVSGTATAEDRATWLAGMKGAYNYTDLNRVGAAVEYLTALLYSLGYNVGTAAVITRTVSLTNIIPNSSFEEDVSWSGTTYSTEQAYQGKRSSALGPGSTTSTSVQVATPIVGHKYYGRSYIKTSAPIQPADCRFEWFAGDGHGLNWVFAWNRGDFSEWTMQSALHTVDRVAGQNYIIRNFVVNAQARCWTDCLMLVDLTAAFGAGNEPDKAWCDSNLPYFSGTVSLPVSLWTETDIPNSGQMEQYLNNVKALRACLPYVAPNAPADMGRLTWQEANDIEEILATLGDVLEAMQAAFLTRQANTLFMIAGGVFNNA